MTPLWPKWWIGLWIIPFKSSIVLYTSTVTFLTLLLWFTNMWLVVDQALDMYGDLFIWSESACRNMEKYDYIVVGAGAAGMVVATRVANYSKSSRVLLLEAGGEVS